MNPFQRLGVKISNWWRGEPQNDGGKMTLNSPSFLERIGLKRKGKPTSEVTYFTCLKMLSETLAKMPIKYYQKTDKGIIEAEATDTSKLLSKRPNPFMTPTTFWNTVEINRNHYGNVEGVTTKTGTRNIEVDAESTPFDNVDEAADFTEMDEPEFLPFEYKVKKKGGILKMTAELLEDTASNIMAYINKWIAKKTKATRNAMILKVLNEMTKGKEVTVENLDSLKDIFNEQLDPAIADNAVVITNQSGFNYLDKLKDKDGNYILQKDPTQQTKGKMLFGEYPIIKLSKKTLASEKIMNTDGHTIDGYKHPIFCGDLKEAVTLFDRNVLTIDLNDKGAGLWDKDMTGIKVRDRFDVQPVDKGAVIKGQITEVING